MHIPRLLISALRGGAGKTLLSLGLARAFGDAHQQVKPYKKGPDYIDAAWLAKAARCACTNLDPFFLPPERLVALLGHSWHTATAPCPGLRTGLPATVAPHLALIEGNRGLFDGRDVHGSCSSAELARILDAPVLLSLDCTKMTRTAAAVLAGLANFEPGLRMGGVVLNQLASARHEAVIRQSIEAYTDIPVLGALPRLRHNPLPERHMGLIDAADQGAETALVRLGSLAVEHLDLPRILALAHSAAPLPPAQPFWTTGALSTSCAPRIGYVHDAALWFYYHENLEALQRAGAELVPLSLLDPTPWPALHGLYLGGGFPEEYADRIAQSPHLARIRALSEAHMPIYAECGGFMVLAQSILRDDTHHTMGGLFPVCAHFHAKPQGLGYVEGTVTRANPFHPAGSLLRGHEFHYSRCRTETDISPLLCLALECGTGMGGHADGLCVRNTFAAYTHIYAPALPWWAENFVRAARQYRGEGEGTFL